MNTDEELIEYWRSRYGNRRIDQAIAIYDDVLIPICKSHSTKGDQPNFIRQEFIRWFAENHGDYEFRFQGDLGFGGKFWDYDGRWYVTYYAEDQTKNRDDIEIRANIALEELKQKLDTLSYE